MSFFHKLKTLDRPVLHLILISLLGLIAYSNTFNAPFQWNDRYYISQNPIIQDLDNFIDLREAGKFKFYDMLRNRYVGYLTFALNYRLHGLDVTGYHIFNFFIHIANAILIYFFVVMTFKTPPFKDNILGTYSRHIALCSSFFFVAHPIQTEAVTYIFQRLASLAAFFYLLSLVLYIKWRFLSELRFNKGGHEGIFEKRNVLYLLALLSAVLAMKTKENAFTLPIMITLYELFFFNGPIIKRRMLFLVPLLLTSLIVPLTHSGGAEVAARGFRGISRWDYLFTQFRVIVTYIRLLILPVGQNIYHDYPVFDSFLKPPVLMSFMFLLSIAGCGAYMFWRSMDKPHFRLFSFGIFWFFITLSVESSIIPIPMLMNEYRVYLPSVGAFLVISLLAAALLANLKTRLRVIAIFIAVIIPLLLVAVTHTRNDLWRSETSLWEDAVSKSPNNALSHLALGNAYMRSGRLQDALKELTRAVDLDPYCLGAYLSRGTVYLFMEQSELARKDYERHDALKSSKGR